MRILQPEEQGVKKMFESYFVDLGDFEDVEVVANVFVIPHSFYVDECGRRQCELSVSVDVVRMLWHGVEMPDKFFDRHENDAIGYITEVEKDNFSLEDHIAACEQECYLA